MFCISYILEQKLKSIVHLYQKQVNSLAASLRYIRTLISAEKTAVFGCFTNAPAPPPIALESCSTAQTDQPVW